MHPARRRFRLGLFVLGSGCLFVALLTFILNGSLRSPRVSYWLATTENVKGLVTGSRVNFQGVPIGAVHDIRFADGNTLVELRVDPTRAAIQQGTRARMDRLLVTGQVTIELEGWRHDAKELPPGAFLELQEDPMRALTASLPDVVDRAARVLGTLDAMLHKADRLLGEDTQAQVAAILAHVERVAARLDRETAVEATALLREGRAAVQDARRAGVELGAAAADARALLREAEGLAGGLRAPLQNTLASLRAAFEDVRGLARQLRASPDSILFGVERPAAPAGGPR